MDDNTRTHLENIHSSNKDLQTQAYYSLMEATDQPVDWAYVAWDDLVNGLSHKDNHVRAISAQLLANLAKSDPNGRIFNDFPALLAVTRDERFVTARHCLQSLWKVGVVGPAQQQLLVDGLTQRFRECISEKNCTLIRYDILQSLRNVYNHSQDETLRERALELIQTEEDAKYRKKYMTLWKDKK